MKVWKMLVDLVAPSNVKERIVISTPIINDSQIFLSNIDGELKMQFVKNKMNTVQQPCLIL